jgi:hypothetical protein
MKTAKKSGAPFFRFHTVYAKEAISERLGTCFGTPAPPDACGVISNPFCGTCVDATQKSMRSIRTRSCFSPSTSIDSSIPDHSRRFVSVLPHERGIQCCIEGWAKQFTCSFYIKLKQVAVED